MRTFALLALISIGALTFGEDRTVAPPAKIEIGTPWSDAKVVLKHHEVHEHREYPALGFEPGKPPDLSETQFLIDEGVFLWFSRDAGNAVRSIQLHVYPSTPAGKPAYRVLQVKSVSFLPDGSYSVQFHARFRRGNAQSK